MIQRIIDYAIRTQHDGLIALGMVLMVWSMMAMAVLLWFTLEFVFWLGGG